MKYIKITIDASGTDIDMITSRLYDIGISSLEVKDPNTVKDIMDKKHSYEWDYLSDEFTDELNEKPQVIIYLEDQVEGREKSELVKKEFEGLNISGTIEDDKEWKDSYKKHFHTTELTPNLIVKPSWESLAENEERKIIELDPGMAFGTGDHETTSMCALLLDGVGCTGKKVLDVGTGSGILAIASAKLGAKEVLGIDIDEDAVRIAKENVDRNGCGGKVRVIRGDLTEGVEFKADIVVANLIAELVVMLTDDVSKHMNRPALFISSGILIEKKKMVTDALEKNGFNCVRILERGGWCAIEAEYE